MAAAERSAPRLPPMPRAVAEQWLAEPWVPAGALSQRDAVVAAASVRVPVLLRVPAGPVRYRLVRALAAVAGIETPIALWDGDGAPPDAAVVLFDPPSWDASRWLTLGCLADDGGPWLFAAVGDDPPSPADLGAAVVTVPFDVPALSARPEKLRAIAERQLARLATRAGRTPPRLMPDAVSRLEAQAWPGDVGELEAVLTRAFLVASDEIAAEALGLDGSPSAPDQPAPATVAPTPPAAPTDQHLELLLAEMAHEIRNPLVTIKTFAGHLPALLEDAPLRERFQQLTDEGIARMEAALDNVLEYGRLGAPQTQAVDVPVLVDRLLDDVQPELTERGIAIARTGAAHATCAADPEHLAFALRNLVTGVAREMPAGESLALDASANGVVRLRFSPGGTTATRLRALAVGDGSDALHDPTLLPLPFTLARTVLERSGGGLVLTPEGGGATALVVRLPMTAS